MARAARTCNNCPTIITTGSRCQACTARADAARGNSAARGYRSKGHQRFRQAVLARDPICTLCHQAWSTIADHYPDSRRDLITNGADPNDPAHGRGLCKPCHDKQTALNQPGGWYAAQRT